MATGQGNSTDLFKSFSVRDWMVVGGGFAVFVFSFFNYVGVSVSLGGISEGSSINAWHSYATLGLLLLIATAVVWALRVAKKVTLPPLPAKFEIIAAGAAGLGTLLILIRAVTYSSSVPGISVGLRFGGILLIISGAVVTAGAAWSHYAGSGVSTTP